MYYAPLPPQRKRRSWLTPILILLLIIVILGVCGFTFYRQQFDNLLRELKPSCTISAFGDTITVQGWSANDDCQKMIYGQDNFTGVNWLKGGAAPANADGPIACEMDISKRHVTVRDNVGNGGVVCTMLNPIMPLPPSQ